MLALRGVHPDVEHAEAAPMMVQGDADLVS
jgi:hypothetical protein